MAYRPAFSDAMQKELAYRKKRDKATYEQAMRKIAQVLENPKIGNLCAFPYMEYEGSMWAIL